MILCNLSILNTVTNCAFVILLMMGKLLKQRTQMRILKNTKSADYAGLFLSIKNLFLDKLSGNKGF